jgi:NAD(P)-dependent dehydrogenase (short-subunit alcohol dehydrogenase family)
VVTGISSALDEAIAPRLLDGGWVVAGVSRRRPGLHHPALPWIQADLLDPTSVDAIAATIPDPTETPMLVDPARVATPPKLPRLGRHIQPREIADLVPFLLGPSGRWITDHGLVVCAGAST